MNVEYSVDRKQIENMERTQEMLARIHVEIGLPESASARNRFLLALHERGAPGAHIPPRPVVGPALAREETRAAVSEGLLAACEAAAAGDSGGVIAGFEEAGQAGAARIRAYIDAGVPPPNAPLTVSGGWIRNFSSGKPVQRIPATWVIPSMA